MTRVHFDITHPAHVHLFRHAIRELADDGHAVCVSSREKEITTDLLDAYDIEHTALSSQRGGTLGLAAEWALREVRTINYARKFDPDVIVSLANPPAVHAAALLGASSVVFHDSENANGVAGLLAPMTDRLCTPSNMETDFGSAQRRYEGFHELAYLHPDRFEPEPDRLREYGVEPEEPYFVLRFVSMGAHHDVGHEGISPAVKRQLVEELSERGEVYISAEGDLPPEFAGHRLPVPPETMHHLLAEAELLVTDSSTMATEAALLGTPAVRSNSYADGQLRNFVELADYDLVISTTDSEEARDVALELADDPDTSERWAERRDRLVADKIDVTSYILDTIEEVAHVDDTDEEVTEEVTHA